MCSCGISSCAYLVAAVDIFIIHINFIAQVEKLPIKSGNFHFCKKEGALIYRREEVEFSDKPFYRDKRDLLMTKVFVHVSTVFCPHITLQSLDMTSFVESQSFNLFKIYKINK